MAHPIKLWNGSAWTDYRNSKMWDGTKWVPLQGKILASNGSWEKIGVEQKVLTLNATWVASYMQPSYGNTQLPANAYGNDIVAGLDHQYDPDNIIRVGDSAVIKNSASRYQTGERMDSWVHGQTIKVIQERRYRGKRALLASSQKVYSWIYEQDLTKIKGRNKYGVREAMVAWDFDVIRRELSGAKLLNAEFMLRKINTGVGQQYHLSTHKNKTKPKVFTAVDKYETMGTYSYSGDKWMALSASQAKYLFRDGCYGFSFRSNSNTSKDPISFHGANTKYPPQMRITYEK